MCHVMCRTTAMQAPSPQASTVILNNLRHQENGPRKPLQLTL